MYKLRSLLCITISLLALACMAQAQVPVPILRGVGLANAVNGNASLGPGQFAFNGAPPTLSLFDTVANAQNAGVVQPCYVQVVVNMPGPPAQGMNGDITLNGHVYIVTFDNNPVGHWSIALGGFAQGVARGDFSANAQAGRPGNIVNGPAPPRPAGVNCR